MTSFSQTLLNWYYENQRTLPWRNETDPYKIWVSEIILQQTRVNQGWNYYLSFIEHFPTIKDLAEAPEEKVLKVWQGLGYYSRARYMHESAGIVMIVHQGVFTNKYEVIR
jgi:A/G-specific adenine glycosylase